MVSKGKIAAVALILLLIPTYIVVVSAMPMTFSSGCAPSGKDVRTTDKMGFCTQIGFSVTRSYYFDTLRLPVNRAGFNLDLLNKTFLPFLLLAAVAVWRY